MIAPEDRSPQLAYYYARSKALNRDAARRRKERRHNDPEYAARIREYNKRYAATH